MSTPGNRRQSLRARRDTNYIESPVDSPLEKKLSRKPVRKSSESDDQPTKPKTPKSISKSSRKAAEESPEFSPKKLRAERTPSVKCVEAAIITISDTDLTPSPVEVVSRRSARSRKSVSRLTYEVKQKAKRIVPENNEIEDETDSDYEIDNINIELPSKPTTLYDENKDIEGSALYSLKTPKKKDSMALLAQRTPKTPRHSIVNTGTPKTPKHNRLSEIMKTPTSRPSASKCGKTPRHVREATKKKIQKVIQIISDEEEVDFSPDESEFEPSESSPSNESSNDEENSSQENETPPKIETETTNLRRSTRSKANEDYVLRSDDYFSTATAKTKTSNHTLDRLKNPRLPQDQLNKMLKNMKLSDEHEKKIRELNEEHKANFDYWLTLFDEGYTVLLHGFGSKRNLMINFHKEKLAKRHVIVVNGFFPSLTIKSILDPICIDLLEMTGVSGNPHEVVSLIEKEMNEIPAFHIFLIIHNLDGTMLRNDKAQSVLSRLASIKNIHMIASIDHINTPLLWNNTKLSNYNFVWFDCTSFLPYTDETAFENSLLIQNSGALELSSMKSVFQSLTSNARKIYILLVNYQLKNSRTPSYQGMPFKELYSACREQFFVSSDVALRAQLTEFLDHKLAKSKRTIDGTESISIPIKSFLLEQFLSEQ